MSRLRGYAGVLTGAAVAVALPVAAFANAAPGPPTAEMLAADKIAVLVPEALYAVTVAVLATVGGLGLRRIAAGTREQERNPSRVDGGPS